jgi:hypothetical protein
MSTITRRKRTPRALNAYQAHELLFGGPIQYPIYYNYRGYGDGVSTNLADFIDAAMRDDWRDNCVVLLDFWHRGEQTLGEIFRDTPPWLNDKSNPDEMPWAEEHLDE